MAEVAEWLRASRQAEPTSAPVERQLRRAGQWRSRPGPPTVTAHFAPWAQDPASRPARRSRPSRRSWSAAPTQFRAAARGAQRNADPGASRPSARLPLPAALRRRRPALGCRCRSAKRSNADPAPAGWRWPAALLVLVFGGGATAAYMTGWFGPDKTVVPGPGDGTADSGFADSDASRRSRRRRPRRRKARSTRRSATRWKRQPRPRKPSRPKKTPRAVRPAANSRQRRRRRRRRPRPAAGRTRSR